MIVFFFMLKMFGPRILDENWLSILYVKFKLSKLKSRIQQLRRLGCLRELEGTEIGDLLETAF